MVRKGSIPLLLSYTKQWLLNLVSESHEFYNRYARRRPLIPLLMLYVAGIFLWVHKNEHTGQIQNLKERGALVGIVSDPPDVRPSGCVYQLKAEFFEDFNFPPKRHSLQEKIMVHVVSSSAAMASPGDRVRVIGRLSEAKNSSIPGTFNYQDYLSSLGIEAVVYSSPRLFENLGPSGQKIFTRWGWQTKKKIKAIFRKYLPEAETTVLAGLTIGERPRFHPEIKKIFIDSGTMHVLIASGSNIAFVMGFSLLILRLLTRKFPIGTLFLSLVVAWGYVGIVGGDLPVLRAALMASVMVLYHAMNKEDLPVHSLFIAALVMLVIYPQSIFDVGFQMSFITVLGLILYWPFLSVLCQSNNKLVSWILHFLWASCVAQLWLLPLSVYIFKKIYPLSIISNVVVVPLSAGGLFAGFWILLLDGLKWFLPSAIVAGGQILIECYLKFLIFMVRFFAHHMSCSFWVGSFDWKFSTGYYLTLLSAIHWKKLLVARIFTIGGCLLMAGVWLKERQESPAPSLSWLDTGRNLSCVFQLSPDKTILINPGALEPSDSTERILLPYLSEKRVSSLSFVLLNRLDPKTASGLITLLNEIPVSRVLVCVPDLERKNMWQTWLNENIKLKKPIYFLHAGEKTNWEGWTIEALPTTKAMGTQTPVLLSYSETKILLGDKWSRTTQRYLLTKKNLKATIMQARFSKKDYWEEEFLNRYQPNQLIEIGHGSQNKPTAPPWTQIACAVPQKAGYLNLPFPKEVNRQKSSSKSPRMRPPGHASGLSSQPLR